MRYLRTLIIFPKEEAYVRKDYSTKKQIKTNIMSALNLLRELSPLPFTCFAEDVLSYTFLPYSETPIPDSPYGEVKRVSLYGNADQRFVRLMMHDARVPYYPENCDRIRDDIIKEVIKKCPPPDRRKYPDPVNYNAQRIAVMNKRLRTAANTACEREPIVVYFDGNNGYCNIREEAAGSALITITFNIYTGVKRFSFSSISMQEDVFREVMKGVM